MNRLWIRLSLSYAAVLLVVLSLPLGLFWFAFAHNGRGRMMVNNGPPLGARVAVAMFGYLLLAALFSLFVGILAGILVSRNLSKQVTYLVRETEAITPDNLQHRIEAKGVQELQDLALSFNRMVGELDQSQQVRRNLLADVSHELLTPLTVLEGNLRAILDDVYSLSKEEISLLYDQTHHMIGLVKELRQLTQAEAQQLPLTRVASELNDIVEETVALFTSLADENEITLQRVTYQGLPLVSVDRQRIRQVLGNLLSNALKYTPAGGIVTIKTWASDEAVHLSVTDSGVGMSKEQLEQIFNRFYRSDGAIRRDSGGSGLGLAIVKALVEAHGGSVSAESAPSQGSTFMITLPIQQTQQVAARHVGLTTK